MPRPYSMDLRDRATRLVRSGESCRSVAATLNLGVSTVIRWAARLRETGSAAPGKMGGHRPYLISGADERWLLERIAPGDFTLRELQQGLADRGLKVDERTVWNFVNRMGFSFKKNRTGRRAEAREGRAPSGAMVQASRWGRWQQTRLHR